MRRAQGNTRQAPDGFLHIQNFTVTKHAGMAGVVYTHILTPAQQRIVEQLLIERAMSAESEAGGAWVLQMFHRRHDAWRFRKTFLQANFREAVHATTKIMQNPVIETFKSKLFTERESLTY